MWRLLIWKLTGSEGGILGKVGEEEEEIEDDHFFHLYADEQNDAEMDPVKMKKSTLKPFQFLFNDTCIFSYHRKSPAHFWPS